MSVHMELQMQLPESWSYKIEITRNEYSIYMVNIFRNITVKTNKSLIIIIFDRYLNFLTQSDFLI